MDVKTVEEPSSETAIEPCPAVEKEPTDTIEHQIEVEIVIEPEVSGMLAAKQEAEDDSSCEAKSTNSEPKVKLMEHLSATMAQVNYLTQNVHEREVQKRRKPTKIHTCDVCNKEFNRINNLRTHQQTHENKPYCDICCKDLLTRKKLRNHIRRFHSETAPYNCEVCNKDFKEAYELKRHTRIHTGEKPYLCEMCDKAFNNAGALKDHRQTHNDEKRFACDLCQKQFKHRYSLKTHVLSHTGKPYACEICNKEFLRPADLKEHMYSHGPLKPYACDKCGTQFYRKDTFYRHAKRKFCMSISDDKAKLIRVEDCG